MTSQASQIWKIVHMSCFLFWLFFSCSEVALAQTAELWFYVIVILDHKGSHCTRDLHHSEHHLMQICCVVLTQFRHDELTVYFVQTGGIVTDDTPWWRKELYLSVKRGQFEGHGECYYNQNFNNISYCCLYVLWQLREGGREVMHVSRLPGEVPNWRYSISHL